MVVGFVGENKITPGREVTNEAALLQDGRIVATRIKCLLPTYDVFDEDRYFEPGEKCVPLDIGGHRCGVTICEDIWNDEDFWPHRRYRANPVGELLAAGAQCILNISASPWHVGKEKLRAAMLASLARKSGRPVALCNLVGGNDELIFDGDSLVFNAGRGVDRQRPSRSRRISWWWIPRPAPPIDPAPAPEEENVYQRPGAGIARLLSQMRFQIRRVLGLSGGIDSAVVACLAAAALGPKNVHGDFAALAVFLPGQPGRRPAPGGAAGHALRRHSHPALF